MDTVYFAENWKHCNKIIFKCVNSIVRPIFNEKIVEKWGLWVPRTVHGTHWCVNSAQQCMNSALCPLKLKHMPKIKKKRKTQNTLWHVLLRIAISQTRDTPHIFIQTPKNNHNHKDLLTLNLITKIRILIDINY